MSSPIIPLGQSWNGVLGGLAVSMQYDATTRTVHGTVRNTLSQKLCYVQAEPHMKAGTKTVGELGPEKLGHLNPGQEATSSLTVASEPELAGVSYDGYVVHMEVFRTAADPARLLTQEEKAVRAAVNTAPDGEGGNESAGAGGEEGIGANALAPDETFDSVRSGARLILNYDAASNSFNGTVENTTESVTRPGQDRSAPFERNGARSDYCGRPGSRPDVADHPGLDAGVVHRMGSPCRGRRGRGRRVGR